MKKLIVLVSCALFVVAELGMAQEGRRGPEGEGRQRRGRQGQGAGAFKALDKDGDGSLSPAELKCPVEIFEKIDADGDGLISEEEAGRGKLQRAIMAGTWGLIDKDAVYAEIDADGDGVATKEEFRAANFGQIIQRALADARTRMGLPQRGGPGQGGGGMIQRLDKDGDGKLSKDEVPERMAERFDKLDKDGDGFITAEEMQAMQRRGRDGQGGPQGGGMIKRLDKDGDGKLSKDEVPEKMAEHFDKLDANGDGVLDEGELGKMRGRRGQGGEGGEGRRRRGGKEE